MRKYQVQTVQTVRHVATHDVAAESFEEASDKAVAMMVSTLRRMIESPADR